MIVTLWPKTVKGALAGVAVPSPATTVEAPDGACEGTTTVRLDVPPPPTVASGRTAPFDSWKFTGPAGILPVMVITWRGAPVTDDRVIATAGAFTVNAAVAAFPRLSTVLSVPAPVAAVEDTAIVELKKPVASVVPVTGALADAPPAAVNVVVTEALGAKPVPLTTVLVPARPFVGFAVRVEPPIVKVPTELVTAPDDWRTTGLAASADTVKVVVKAPVPSVVVTGAVNVPAERKIVLIVSPAAKPVPFTVTRVPLGPETGLSVNGAPGANRLGAADARGAANSIGRLLMSSAAVSVNAAKLLRSEFKVPSSSER